jgi:HlyD family secretion protein
VSRAAPRCAGVAAGAAATAAVGYHAGFVKTILTIVITAAVVIAAAVFLVPKMGGGFSRPVPPTTVRVEKVAVGTLVESVSAPGTVRPETKVSISARVSARIEALPFAEGQRVTKGDPNANPPVPASVLVKLDASDLEAQLRAAEARRAAQAQQITVAGARIDADVAQIAAQRVLLADALRELNRQKALLSSSDVSQQAVDQAQAKYDQLAAQIESAEKSISASKANLEVLSHELDAAEAEIARARDNLSYTTIASPIDGVVTKLNAEVGELVVTGTMNNAGTVILEVADLSRMLVVARLDETTIANVEKGQTARVRISAYPDEVFTGTVKTVALKETEAKDGSRHYETEILLDTRGKHIVSGLTADVDIETRKHPDVLRVPSQAVLGRPVDDLPPELRDKPEVDRTRTYATVVYRVVNGKSVVTPVSVGASDVTHTVIRSGLSAGDEVVVGPYKVLEALQHNQSLQDEAAAATQPATKPK